ncbi:hypothetical protein C0581_01690 [Candidatus Parcubacteria bacterium]|nr:MAG: hypothetical protein C0581_01690 [Candidatus Parcubacteria bacterium]
MLLDAVRLAAVPPAVVDGLLEREDLDGRHLEPLPDDREVRPRGLVLPDRAQLSDHEVAVPAQDRVVVGAADTQSVLAVARLGERTLLRVRDLRTEDEHEHEGTEDVSNDVHLGTSTKVT